MTVKVRKLMDCPSCGGKACMEKGIESRKVGFNGDDGPKITMNDCIIIRCKDCDEILVNIVEVRRWRENWKREIGVK